MKFFAPFIIVMLSINLTFAQTYSKFQFGNTRWMYNKTNTSNITTSYCYFSKDTTGYYYNGNKFWKIEYLNSPNYSPTLNGIYINDDTVNKKIYLIDTTTNILFLLYDFSRNQGDTINSIYNMGVLDSVIVDSIRYYTINNFSRKHIYIHSINNLQNSKLWLEGIGSSFELFYPSLYLPDPLYNLACQEYNQSINYGSFLTCSNFITSIQTIEKKHLGFNIKYYQSTNLLTAINHTNVPYTLLIYDLSGRLILKKAITNFLEEIYIHALPNTILFYSALIKNKEVQKGKVQSF